MLKVCYLVPAEQKTSTCTPVHFWLTTNELRELIEGHGGKLIEHVAELVKEGDAKGVRRIIEEIVRKAYKGDMPIEHFIKGLRYKKTLRWIMDSKENAETFFLSVLKENSRLRRIGIKMREE